MIEVDWKKDYKGEFICYRCNHSQMKHAGFHKGIKQLTCEECRYVTSVAIALSQRSKCLNFRGSNLKHKTTDWEKDYQGKFICPNCHNSELSFGEGRKRKFRCKACLKIEFPFLPSPN